MAVENHGEISSLVYTYLLNTHHVYSQMLQCNLY